MDYVITEEQFFDVLSDVFDSYYPKLKTKEISSTLYVYYGYKLVRFSLNSTYIMQYVLDRDELWIDAKVYNKIKRVFPSVTNNLLFFDFFKKWFSDKFGMTAKKVYITNEATLSDLYNS